MAVDLKQHAESVDKTFERIKKLLTEGGTTLAGIAEKKERRLLTR